ncbi:hypothetical protein BMS3Bbin14_00921 [bacterium BMS3Bbin14]|nr:hypothetical protein BMS3Abin13_01987 [bacterium BMS3Abin13]GBE52450.1 hypothetical protein BMS3Bbin14_00921 [bacterium BMS3Bbin14]
MQIASLRDLRGGNDVDYPGVISRSCQRSRGAVIGRPAGRRGEGNEMNLLKNNAINSICYMEYHLKPSRIQVHAPAVESKARAGRRKLIFHFFSEVRGREI